MTGQGIGKLVSVAAAVCAVVVPAVVHELKRTGDRVTGISWSMNIKPGEFAEFSFVARNPRDKEQLVWDCGSASPTGPSRTLRRDIRTEERACR